MPHTIKMDPREKLGAESVVSAQSGKAGELRILFSILEKVRSPKGYRELYLRNVPGGAAWNEDALAVADATQVELETEEVHKILEVVQNWPHFMTSDFGWVTPLIRKLKECLEENPARKRR